MFEKRLTGMSAGEESIEIVSCLSEISACSNVPGPAVETCSSC